MRFISVWILFVSFLLLLSGCTTEGEATEGETAGDWRAIASQPEEENCTIPDSAIALEAQADWVASLTQNTDFETVQSTAPTDLEPLDPLEKGQITTWGSSNESVVLKLDAEGHPEMADLYINNCGFNLEIP